LLPGVDGPAGWKAARQTDDSVRFRADLFHRRQLTPIVGQDRSFINAISIITSIAATHYVLVFLRNRLPSIGHILDGTPLVLLEKGVIDMAREQRLIRLEQVDYAILERNGEISIVPASKQG
jgi:uncharacterized membrane protein YcaP (DUF421 family)